METTEMTVSMWSIDRIIPYSRNARKIPQSAIDKVAASIKEFGWRQPIVVDSEGVIIAGHTRLLAARKLGLSEVPVHIAEELTAAQIKAYRLADNRIHEEAKWDNEMLSIELVDLRDSEIDLALTGFDPDEMDILMNGPQFGPGSLDEQGKLDEKKAVICPHCSYEFTP